MIKNGRKSFREISRDTGITTPTVKARFERLVNVGFIKSVSPIFDFGIVDEDIMKPTLENENKRHKGIENEKEKQCSVQYMQRQLKDARSRIKKGLRINLDCEFCKGPITSNPHVFRFANLERFLNGSFESIKRKYEGKDF